MKWIERTFSGYFNRLKRVTDKKKMKKASDEKEREDRMKSRKDEGENEEAVENAKDQEEDQIFGAAEEKDEDVIF